MWLWLSFGVAQARLSATAPAEHLTMDLKLLPQDHGVRVSTAPRPRTGSSGAKAQTRTSSSSTTRAAGGAPRWTTVRGGRAEGRLAQSAQPLQLCTGILGDPRAGELVPERRCRDQSDDGKLDKCDGCVLQWGVVDPVIHKGKTLHFRRPRCWQPCCGPRGSTKPRRC